MATKRRTGGTQRLTEDLIVSKNSPQEINPACLERQDYNTVIGFLGESPQRGFWRVYLSPDLDEYYEIAEGDILEQICHDDGADFRTSEIRVQRGANVVHVRSDLVDLQSRFLVGELSRSFLNSPETQGLLDDVRTCGGAGFNDREKRQSNNEWFCTYYSGCTEGKAGGRECTYRFGPPRTPGAKTKFHVTKDLKC